MEKISPLFNAFTQRFGSYPLKEGQSLISIQRSWERILGGYAKKDLVSVCQHWCDTAKYPRWPEPGEILILLKEWRIEPERIGAVATDNRPEHIKQAERDASSWYVWISKQPLADLSAFPATNDTAVQYIIGVGEPENFGKSFSFLLTKAWLAGTLPGQWDVLSKAYFEHVKKRKADYVKARSEHGHVGVNERLVRW